MLDEQWLATFAPVGTVPGPDQWRPTGAGVFISHHNVVWLVTAAHVVTAGAVDVGALVAVNGPPTAFNLTSLLASSPGISWVTSDVYDVAAVPMPTPDGIELKALSEAQCRRVGDILPSTRCVTAGCPYGLAGVAPGKHTPLVLDGIVAGTDVASKALFISTPTFQGNSGGPIFVSRPPYSAGGRIVAGTPTVHLAGIVTGIQTVRPASQDAAPLRLGVGVAVDVILDLLNGPEATEIARVMKSMHSESPPPASDVSAPS